LGGANQSFALFTNLAVENAILTSHESLLPLSDLYTTFYSMVVAYNLIEMYKYIGKQKLSAVKSTSYIFHKNSL